MTPARRPVHLAFALLTAMTFASPSPAADALQVGRDWSQNWKNFARRVIKLDGEYHALAMYESQFPSSRGTTTVALRQKTAQEITEKWGSNAKIRRVINRPDVELNAAVNTLPGLATGQYGQVHSVEILGILGPDEMVVGGIWLIHSQEVEKDKTKDIEKILAAGVDRREMGEVIDWMYEARDTLGKKQREREYRGPIKLKGFSTIGLAKGDRWRGKDGAGIELAMVGYAMVKNSRSKREDKMPLAVPVELFKRPLDNEKEFLAYLENRKFSKESFVLLVTETKKANPRDERLADALVFDRIEENKEKAADEKEKK